MNGLSGASREQPKRGPLRSVPTHWQAKRLKYVASINDDVLQENTTPERSIAYVDISNVDASDGILGFEEITFEDAPSRARRLVRDGDTIVSTVRTYLRAIAPVKRPRADMVVSTGFAVVRPRQVSARYLSFALRETHFIETIVARSVGVSYPAINASDVGDIVVAVPPEQEQEAIATFLDGETTKIDALVAKKRMLIEKLREKRTALISRTLTRGLPPDEAGATKLASRPTLKFSGIDWLGDVPVHWNPVRLKHLLEAKKGAIKTGPFGSQLHSSEMVDGDVKVYNQRTVIDRDIAGGDNYISTAKFDELRAFEVFPEDLLVTTRGTIGRCMIVPRHAERGILHPCLIRIQVKQVRVLSRFLETLIQESGQVLNQLQIMSNATTIEVIYSESLKEVWLAIPPIQEQVAMIEYLDREVSKVDILIGKVAAVIERLHEYRAALITAAVTGQIDVRPDAPSTDFAEAA